MRLLESPSMKHTEETHSPGVYQVRPDKTTSVVGIVGMAAFAWFANQWAAGVSTDSTEALRKASEALTQQQRQADEIRQVTSSAERSIEAALAPMKQRVEDLRTQASRGYDRQEAERDKALVSQELAQLKASTEDNQNTLQRLIGRIESQERQTDELARRLEQVVQAVLERNRGSDATPSTRRPTFLTGYQEECL